MKKKVALLACFLLIFTLIKVPYRIFSPKLWDHFVSEAATFNILLQSSDFKLHFPLNAKALDLNTYIPRNGLPFPVFCKEINYKHSLINWLLLKNLSKTKANCYEGALNLEVTQGFFSEKLKTSLETSDIQIHNHPLAKNFGLMAETKVTVDAELDQQLPELLHSAKGAISIRDGTYIGGYKIKGLIPLPAVEDLILSSTFDYDDKIFRLEELNFDSSLGSGEGSGQVEFLNPQQIKSANLRFILNLTEKGRKEFGSYLALATGKSSDEAYHKWRIKLNISPRARGFGYKTNSKIVPIR